MHNGAKGEVGLKETATMKRAKEGTLRLLTLEEIALAHSIFGGSIDYARVWIHCDSYLPFGLQRRDTAMSPNGEIWFRKELYQPNFAAIQAPASTKHLFIHEMMHVWQYQRRMWVRARGFFSWAANYTYQLDGRPLLQYSLEQQAQIVADYFILYTFGYKVWDLLRKQTYPVVTYQGNIDRLILLSQYQKTIYTAVKKG